ncbi:MAG: PucR family transcriptional regulator [Lachnospiraceae bacterium]|nr:PucR family transcriptional regulator [Lachnospiraceae bacterium]
MLNVLYLAGAMGNTVLEQRTGTRELEEFQGIILLKNQSKLLGNYLYVGMLADGLRLLEKCRPEIPVTMFLSAEDVNQVHLPEGTVHNFVVSALDIFDIYNRVNRLVQNYHYWSRTLREMLCSGADLARILEHASQLLKNQIFVLNPGYRQIAGSSCLYFEEPLSRELSDHGWLSYESSLVLFPGNTGIPDSTCPRSAAASAAGCRRTVSPADTQPPPASGCQDHPYRKIITPQTVFHTWEIRRESAALATLLLPDGGNLDQVDVRHLLEELAAVTAHFLLTGQEAFLQQDALCAAFIRDIAQEQLTGADEIENRISFLPHALKPFAAFVLVRFDKAQTPAPPYGYMLRMLGELFPHTNMAVYQDDIVILHTQQERPQKGLDFDYEKLDALLKAHHAWAGISNASRHRVRLRTLYLIACETIRLGRFLHRKGLPERILSYEDYSLYYIVSLGAARFMEVHHHDDLIYLVHPSIIRICRYDATHKTNLRDVLFYYLLCGCSLNRTAAAMYMHRNTVLNKLNRINEIAEIPLEDGYTQQRMIMSCIIMRYYEDYMHLSIRL